MTTYNYSTPISHTSSAGFQAWGSELSAAIQLVGAVKTADTGQIDWVTVVKPASGSAGGYEIFRFDDPLQATAPIFFKVEYGTASSSSTSYPQIWITVGTGSNGAGTLTGVLSTRAATTGTSSASNGSLQNTTDAFTTYLCMKDGFLGCLFKVGAAYYGEPNAISYFMIGRSANDDGTESTEASYCVSRTGVQNATTGQQYPAVQCLRNTDGIATPRTSQFSMVPGGVTNTLVDGQPQAFKCYIMMPRMRPVLHMACVLNSEYPVGTSFEAALMGATPRTYLSAGTAATYAGAVQNSNHTFAMLWE